MAEFLVLKMDEVNPKMPQTETATQTNCDQLCEPAQSKCTWTSHKGSLVPTAQMEHPNPGLNALP